MTTSSSPLAPLAPTGTRSSPARPGVSALSRALIAAGIVLAIPLGLAALFVGVIGDCFENCSGYNGYWAESGRYTTFLFSFGLIVLVLAIAATFSQKARRLLAVVSATMLAIFVLVAALGIPVGDIPIPIIDIHASALYAISSIGSPAAALWLAGSMVGLRSRRRQQSDTPNLSQV